VVVLEPIERLMNALLLKEVDRKPIVPFTQTGTLELMAACGSYWPAAHRDPDKMAKLAMAAYDIGGFEGVRVPFGLYAESRGLGCTVDYVETGDKPPIVHPPISLDVLKKDADPLASEDTRVVIEAVKVLQGMNRPEIPIIVGVQGPFTLAGNLMGVSQLLLMSIKDPDRLDRILEVTSSFVRAYIGALVDAGADVVSLCDAMASGEFLGPGRFEKCAFPHLKRVIEPCKVPLVLHMCHNCTPLIPLLVKTGAKSIGVDQKVDLRKAKESTGQMVSIVGNINPIDIMIKKPDELSEIAKGVIESGVDVVAPGCGLLAPTPTANILALTKTVKEYRPN
jgi:MtaA/CmuA family methyltransferase